MKTLIALLIVAASAFPSFAASSEWDVVDGAKIRLIGLPAADGRNYRAGLQIELEPGWKTYWRNPGSSGLPPQLTFAASTNVRETILRYPAPRFFEDDGSIGYKNSVTFPITVEPAIAGAPLTLNVSGIVGICSDICIPTQIDLSMKATKDAGSAFDVVKALNEWESKVPLAPQQGMALEGLERAAATPMQAIITTRVPEEAKELELFVEGPFSLYLTRAKLVERDGSRARFGLDLSEQKNPAKLDNVPLLFTLKADSVAIEQKISLKPIQP